MLPAAKSPPRFVTLVILTGLSTLSLSMFLPSLANIAVDFQADYALVSLSIAGYAAATAVLQLILGPLSDRYGRRPVMLSSIAIFCVASGGCYIASDIWTFLAFRMLQGTVIAGWVIAAASVRDVHDTNEAASLLGYISMAMAVAPMLGPMIGGLLDDAFGWRSTFAVLSACGVAVFILTWVDQGETNLIPSKTFAAQFETYPELIRSRRFWGYAICMASTTAAFYSFLAGVPLVAQTLLEMSTALLGIYMGVTTVGFFLGSFLAARLTKHSALSTSMILGRIVPCIGLVAGLAVFAFTGVNAAALFGAAFCVGLGNGLTLPSTGAGLMSVQPKLAGSAAGLGGALTLGAGAIASAATGAILTPDNGGPALLWIMLVACVIGLVAALDVRRIEAREGIASPVSEPSNV